MTDDPVFRVFISYTATDLEAHADVAADAVRKVEWVAIDHQDWAPSGRPSVQECVDQVSRCQVLVVLVAYRYGWVPSVAEDGDGERSITWLEVETAPIGASTRLWTPLPWSSLDAPTSPIRPSRCNDPVLLRM